MKTQKAHYHISPKLCGLVKILASATLLFFHLDTAVFGETCTVQEARQVAGNWLIYITSETGKWGQSMAPSLGEEIPIVENDTLLGYIFNISPSGFICVPALKGLSPIKAYSDEGSVNISDLREKYGIPALLRDVLQDRLRAFVAVFGSMESKQQQSGGIVLDPKLKTLWQELSKPETEFRTNIGYGLFLPLTEVGPLITTSWHQDAPFNNLCPAGDGCQHTPVGCAATAAAQIAKYWNWPISGTGSHTDHWDGDDCNSPHDGTDLTVDLSDTYDWANMPNSCNGGCNPDQQAAVSELGYELGVAMDMDYGCCGSGAYFSNLMTALVDHFKYDPSIEQVNRSNYSQADWFQLIKDEIDDSRVLEHGFWAVDNSDPQHPRWIGHAIVCDGWRDTGGTNQYHMNYGWNDTHTAWYTIDALYIFLPYQYQSGMDVAVRNIIPISSDLCGDVYDGHYGPLGPAGSPYYIRSGCTENVTVPVTQELTINAGTIIYFEAFRKIEALGVLNIYGTDASPVRLISGDPQFPGEIAVKRRLLLQNFGKISVGNVPLLSGKDEDKLESKAPLHREEKSTQ
jgi:hypothetical protein